MKFHFRISSIRKNKRMFHKMAKEIQVKTMPLHALINWNPYRNQDV